MKPLLLILFCLSYTCLHAQNRFAPDYLKAQFAGNIGFLSVGAGFDHARNKMETGLHFGYMPESVGGDHIFSLTAKTTFFPINKKQMGVFALRPLSVGTYASYSFGSQFDTLLPNEYPEGYYWWATSLRFGLFFGGDLAKEMSGQSFKKVSVYYELGTYDLLLISYFQNFDYLSLDQIFNLALGIKLNLD